MALCGAGLILQRRLQPTGAVGSEESGHSLLEVNRRKMVGRGAYGGFLGGNELVAGYSPAQIWVARFGGSDGLVSRETGWLVASNWVRF
jgi:hypothetical protein